MNLQEYQDKASLTLLSDEELGTLTLSAESNSLAWNTLGLAGEAGEVADYIRSAILIGQPLNSYKLTDELGDVLWYIFAIAEAVNLSLEDVINAHTEKVEAAFAQSEKYAALAWYSLGLMSHAGRVADYVKKVVYHGHTLNTVKPIDELNRVFQYLCAIADKAGISLEDVMQVNITKLERRYPNGFTSTDSINRNE